MINPVGLSLPPALSQIPLEDTASTRSSFTVQDLRPFTEHVFRIRCSKADGRGYWSAWSAEASGTTSEDRECAGGRGGARLVGTAGRPAFRASVGAGAETPAVCVAGSAQACGPQWGRGAGTVMEERGPEASLPGPSYLEPLKPPRPAERPQTLAPQKLLPIVVCAWSAPSPRRAPGRQSCRSPPRRVLRGSFIGKGCMVPSWVPSPPRALLAPLWPLGWAFGVWLSC